MDYLTNEEAEKVFAWCEENHNYKTGKQNPLAEAYLSACSLIGAVETWNNHELTAFAQFCKRNIKRQGSWPRIRSCENRAFKARDYLGRIILEVIEGK